MHKWKCNACSHKCKLVVVDGDCPNFCPFNTMGFHFLMKKWIVDRPPKKKKPTSLIEVALQRLPKKSRPLNSVVSKVVNKVRRYSD